MRISDWSSDVCSSDLPGIGPEIISSLLNFYAEPESRRIANQLADEMKIEDVVHVVQESPVSGLTIVFTGSLATMTRDEAKAKAESPGAKASRSEEHTSELQSLMRISYAVFCLKKKIYTHVKQFNILRLHT